MLCVRDKYIGNMHIRNKLKVLGLFLSLMLSYRWAQLYQLTGFLITFSDPCIVFGSVILIVIWDIIRRRPGEYFGMWDVFSHYLIQRVLCIFGYYIYKKFNKLSKNVQEQQNKLLVQILEKNRCTLVAKEMGVSDVRSVEDFRKKIKLTTYGEYEKFATEVEETPKNDVFFPGKTDYIAFTSGTTSGKSKKFPKSVSVLQRTSAKWMLLVQLCIQNIPKGSYVRRWLAVLNSSNMWRSKSGVMCGSISSFISKYSINSYIVPKLTQSLKDHETMIYVSLVFGLKHRDVSNLFFSTSQMALVFFQTLEHNWSHICEDIERGLLRAELKLSTAERSALNKALGKPDKVRADNLRREIQAGFTGSVARFWPECPGLFCLATGSFKTQAKLVKEKYLGDVPLFSPFHAGTEAIYGINLHVEEPEVTYTLMVPYIYFEFIPEEFIEESCPSTVLGNQVMIGKNYELVVTTWEGLYRYRTEDIVQIAGFYGDIPRYKFVRRRGDILSALLERVPETLVSEAVRLAAMELNTSLVEFVSVESTHLSNISGNWCDRHHYIVFVEFCDDTILSDNHNMEMVDCHLMQLHETYARFRQSGKLGPLRVVQVRVGTFKQLGILIRSLNRRSSVMQFKLPRIIRRQEFLSYLLEQIIFPTGTGEIGSKMEEKT